MSKIREFLGEFKSVAKKGMFHIFGSSAIAHIGGLLSSVFVIRRLPKSSYGDYVSASNIYSYIAVFIGLGLFSAVIQFCSEKIDEEKKNSIYRFTFPAGTAFNVVLFAGILAAGLIMGLAAGNPAGIYLAFMAGIPFVVYCNSYFQAVLRVKRLNKKYAYTNICFAVATLISNIVFTYFFGTAGLIISSYLSNIVAVSVASIFLSRESFFGSITKTKTALDKKDKKSILSFSLLCAVTNFTSSMLVLLDVTCLGIVLKDSEILADYKVASIIPAACLFIPTSLITFFYPLMVEKYSGDIKDFKNYILKILRIFICVNAVVLILIEVFSPYVVSLIYGEKYMNVSHIFRILGVNYFLSSVTVLFGNTIAVMKKVKMNLIFAVISGLVNIGLNLILIQSYGSAGAAAATVTVTSLIIVMQVIFFITFYKKTQRENRLADGGLNEQDPDNK